MIQSMLALAPQHRYSLFPSFRNFYFDVNMPVQSPYSGRDVHYGPRHLSREAAALFWSGPEAEALLGKPDVIHANNFWCPTQLVSSRLIYTFYDMSFVVNPAWTTEINRAACFDGVCRSALAADWVVATPTSILRCLKGFGRAAVGPL